LIIYLNEQATSDVLNSFQLSQEVKLNHKKIKEKGQKGQMSLSGRFSRVSGQNRGVTGKNKFR